MAPKNTTTAGTDLLGSLTEDGNGEVIDLLDEIGEDDDAEPWGNPDDTEAGSGIQGTVLQRRTTTSDFTPEPIPVVVIQTADGAKRRITGYQSVLRREIAESDPQPGDLFACKYFGKKVGKKSQEFHHYKAVTRPGARPAAPAQTSKPPF